ncbi:hypothetical protein Cch01nite_04650 [Cellulomonas chitinilytica]|uniref:Uncharacterized protein n=1 Tax=Cellulomonas chitinilytica TaxID=398759 RepID=A0A919P152_9CELL|nr:hypothetical protein [Cellulomonas chitinilytica]GIG19741.1 hypothetical protein Cch01nite_04650 [Cellulomonas chitinilytica]
MDSDLDALLARGAGDLERQVPAMADRAFGSVRGAVRRRRVRRHAVESVAAVAGVAAVGVVAWLGAAHGTPAPAHTPSVTSSTSPSATPSSSPSATSSTAPPTAPPDDAAGIARVLSPSTGETWQEPVEDPGMTERLTEFGGQRAFLVGHHGDASIYALVNDEWPSSSIEGLYERVGETVSLIGCPVSADRCSPRVDGSLEHPGLLIDTTTRYESLTVPTSIRVSPTFGVTTTATTAVEWRGVYGDGGSMVGGSPLGYQVPSESRTLRQIGGARLVELRSPASGVVPGLTPLHYAYVTPMGGAFLLEAKDVDVADVASFRWDDGVDRPSAYPDRDGSGAPGAQQCFLSLLAAEADHVDADWRAAGTASDGRRVWVPVPGGNPVSHAVYAHERDSSFTYDEASEEFVDGAAAYPYTEEQFLDHHALFAVQGPDDEWLLGLREDSAATVYECA